MKYISLFGCILLSHCAVLHQYSMGDIQAGRGNLKKFTIMKSELGIEVAKTASTTAQILRNSGRISQRDADKIQGLATILALSNMGLRTGKAVYDETYLDSLAKKIYEKCPSGEITGLISIRESAQYPVISGEIGKIVGYCYGKLKEEESSKEKNTEVKTNETQNNSSSEKGSEPNKEKGESKGE